MIAENHDNGEYGRKLGPAKGPASCRSTVFSVWSVLKFTHQAALSKGRFTPNDGSNSPPTLEAYCPIPLF